MAQKRSGEPAPRAASSSSGSGSVDANALLDWLLYRNAGRVEAFQNLIDTAGSLQVADITVVEVAYVLEKVYLLPRDLILENISRVIEDAAFSCNRQLFRLVLSLYVSRHSLSFADCYAAYYADTHSAGPLYTFDRKLVSQSGGLAVRIEKAAI